MSSATPSAAPPNLREFTAGLRRDGELVEIEAQVDSRLEAAEIHRRVIAAGGPALWFSNVRGCDFPLVTNLFGTASRVERAFGRWPREFIAEIARLPEEMMPPTLGKLWSKRGLFGALAKVGTRQSKSGAVCEVIETPPRLARLPALQTWARDGGRFITLPLVFTQHPRTHTPNLGMYRIQLYDEHDGGSRTGLHMQIGKGGGFHLAEAEARNEALPVNVFVGGPPALMLSAIAPLPENVPEILLASLLLRKKLSLAKNPSGPLPLFADAEFALVGEVQSGARRAEGPFGAGFHSAPFQMGSRRRAGFHPHQSRLHRAARRS
jgi:UbiD family decarboxylase